MTLKHFGKSITTSPISQLKRGYRDVDVIGIDTETTEGKPLSIQLFSDKGYFFEVTETNVSTIFLNWLDNYRVKKRVKTHLFLFNAAFDLIVIFYPYWKEMVNQEVNTNEFSLEVEGWKLSGFGFRESVCVTLKKDKKSFTFTDITKFYNGSLDNLSKRLLGEGKKDKPKELGKDKGITEYFKEYAIQDAYLTKKVGQKIVEAHQEYDVTLSISIAHLAEKIFRRHYLKKIKELPLKMIEPSLLSYHGGRNGYYLGAPKEFPKLNSYDIVSAYPYAMATLPTLSNGKFYETAKFYPEFLGIYCISGKAKGCIYPSFFDNDFKVLSGTYSNVWITGHELAEALIDGEDIEIRKGFVWVNASSQLSDLSKYVQYFFTKKQNTPKDSSDYLHTKILLNALYGKFQQITETNKGELVAGKLFNPFISSQITGKVRAMLHKLEHRFNAVHSATDSIKTLVDIPEENLSTQLGGLTLEVTGRCILIRARLYLHYNESGQLSKCALHGFHGNPEQLEQVWRRKGKTYQALHVSKPIESLRRKINPLVFSEREMLLNY